MRRLELIASIIVSFVLGLGIVFILSGGRLSVGKSVMAIQTGVPIVLSPAKPISTANRDLTPTFLPSPSPIVNGSKKGPDLDDLLLLYNSSARHTAFDINFCKITEYYGLLCKMVPLEFGDITDETLRDPQGNYYKLVAINARDLLRVPPILSEAEIKILKSAVSGGLNLLISGMNSGLNPAVLSQITNGAVQGATQPQDSQRDWIVSSTLPEITRELSGQSIIAKPTVGQGNFRLLIEPPATSLLSSKDNLGEEYPIFIRWNNGGGSVFVYGGEVEISVNARSLKALYYDSHYFGNTVPIMLAVRYAAGEEAWHNIHNYANLTIDDATLTEPFHRLSYTALLREMEAHNFHTTIALIPQQWQKFNLRVVKIFQLHPDRFSLVQHGNHHDGYEFYKYSLADNDPRDDLNFRARPLADQEADIVEGQKQMERMSNILKLPFDHVMIFPYGISPEPTLALLKKYNFMATVNYDDVPLGSTRPTTWDYGMYPAEMHWASFPMLTRRHPGTYRPFQPDIQPFIFDLFIDKPALMYSHAYQGADEDELFAEGIEAFDPVADHMNHLVDGVEWQSLGYIAKHLFLEKRNDDGSMDVKMYSNNLSLRNASDSEQLYHVSKEESLNVSIVVLTINNQDFPYYMEDNLLKLDVRIPANTSIEIQIQYAD